jgi:hypothetical protein
MSTFRLSSGEQVPIEYVVQMIQDYASRVSENKALDLSEEHIAIEFDRGTIDALLVQNPDTIVAFFGLETLLTGKKKATAILMPVKNGVFLKQGDDYIARERWSPRPGIPMVGRLQPQNPPLFDWKTIWPD